MIVVVLTEAETDLEQAFDYYQARSEGLGLDLLDEFRRGVELIRQFPRGWQLLDRRHRRYRLHRFPYGIVYRVGRTEIQVLAFMHLARHPRFWRHRARGYEGPQ
jgi:plasmid stabilization system protein ParE